mmetsp:Transcript_27421/g.26221  ORF Transcript_27421/g.26221 Transcript_27421/m.26221 type:complete len:137 (-) Transcript_27421:236-646(-)
MYVSSALKRFSSLRCGERAISVAIFNQPALTSNISNPSLACTQSVYNSVTSSIAVKSCLLNKNSTVEYLNKLCFNLCSHDALRASEMVELNELESLEENAIWFGSTMKKRRAKMNKHKLKKRKKSLRMNTKISRGR